MSMEEIVDLANALISALLCCDDADFVDLVTSAVASADYLYYEENTVEDEEIIEDCEACEISWD